MAQQASNPVPGALPGRLQGSSHRFPYVAWLMALVWTAIAAGLLYADLRPARGIPPWVAWGAIGLFALPGLFFLWYSVSASLRYSRYRALRLELSPLPALTGRMIAGALDVPVPYDPAHRYAVRVEAIEYSRDRLMPRNMIVHVVHQEDLEARASPGAQGTRLRFALRIPAEAQPSEGYGETMRWTPAMRERVYRRWTLNVHADVPGVDLKEEFEIPVDRGAAAEATPAEDMPSAGLSSALSAARAMPRTPSYENTQEGARWVIRQPAWKKPGTPPSHVFALVAFFSLFFFAGAAATYFGGAWLVGGVLIAVGLGFGVAVFVAAASELRAEIGRDGVLIRRSLWGLRLKQVQLDRSRIASVEVVTLTAPGGGAPNRSVEVREPGGVLHCIAEFILSVQEAEALRDKVIAHLGFTPGAEAGKAARDAAGMAEQRARRRGGKSDLVKAGFVALMALQGAYWLHPEWFSFFGSAPPQSEPAAVAPPAPVSGVEQAMIQASRHEYRGDLKAAIAQFDSAIRAAREEKGEAHPQEAWVLYRRAQAQRRARDVTAAKESLDGAMRIMERYAPAEAHKLLGNRAGEFDIERLAMYGGEFLWDERRYADAHGYYVKAWNAGLEVLAGDAERNFRRASSSAGVMVTACMLGNWELADKSMAELKQRYASVASSAKEGLKYWIDTGEPRLKARKC